MGPAASPLQPSMRRGARAAWVAHGGRPAQDRTDRQRIHPARHQEHRRIVVALHKLAETSQCDGQNDGREATPQEHAPLAQIHDDRPDQVKLLFDGQAPEVVQQQAVRPGLPAITGIEHVAQITPEPRRPIVPDLLLCRIAPKRRHNGDGRQHEIVKREDAQGPAGVEMAEEPAGPRGLPRSAVGSPCPRIQQVAGDQKPGEDKEQIDARPPGG